MAKEDLEHLTEEIIQMVNMHMKISSISLITG